MIGVVLSGGKSSRMGQDKGLIKADNSITWAKMSLDKLAGLGLRTLVSVNELQLPEYLRYFDKHELVVDRGDLNVQGPLVGVLSAHLLHPEEDILVLACDMIKLKSIILEKLTEGYENHLSEATAFKGKNTEPLCAIYSGRGLKKIKSLAITNSLKNHGLKYILDMLETNYLPISDDWRWMFESINRPEDLP